MTLATAVAIFSDHDIDSATEVTALLEAVIRFAPERLQPRVYAIGAFEIDSPQYFITTSWNSGPSTRPDLRLRIPQMRRLERAVQTQQARVVHIATAGVMGLAGRRLARRLEPLNFVAQISRRRRAPATPANHDAPLPVFIRTTSSTEDHPCIGF